MEEPVKKRDARQKKKAIDVDMNPMVDLAFLLLTFFMLATTFSKPQAMELVMPIPPAPEDEEQHQAIKESKALTLVLAEEDQVYWYNGITEPVVQQASFGQDEIGRILRKQKTEIQDLMVLIKPDTTSRYKNLVDLLDEINIQGIQRYAITDITEGDRNIIQSFKTEQ